MNGQISLEMLLVTGAMFAALAAALPIAAQLSHASQGSLEAQHASYAIGRMGSLCRKAELMGPGFSETFSFMSPSSYPISSNLTHYFAPAASAEKRADCILPPSVRKGRNSFRARNEAGTISILPSTP